MIFTLKSALLALIASSAVASAFPGYDDHKTKCFTKYVTKVRDVYVPVTKTTTSTYYKPYTTTKNVKKTVTFTVTKPEVTYSYKTFEKYETKVITTSYKTTYTKKVPVTTEKLITKTKEIEKPYPTTITKEYPTTITKVDKVKTQKTKTKTVTKCVKDDKHDHRGDRHGWKDESGKKCDGEGSDGCSVE